MPTTNVTAGAGTFGDWTYSGDSNLVNCLATAGDSKYLYMNNDAGVKSTGRIYNLGVGGIPTYCTISSVYVYAYTQRVGGIASACEIDTDLSGANEGGGVQWTLGSLQYFNRLVDRPGGGSWTRSDLGNIGFKIKSWGNGNGSEQFRFDHVYFAITWAYISPSQVTTSAATSVTSSGAILNCTINPNGDAGGTYRIVYGTSSGSYDSPSFAAVSGGGSQSPTRTLTGLNPNQTYYFRVEYKNSGGTQTNGSELTFTTSGGAAGLILFF